jgi:ABC-type antimicrobial peptide transport system permease subunit
MRSFGAKRGNIFGMVWKEVALLTLIACIIGWIIWLQFAFNIGVAKGMSEVKTGLESDWVNTFWLHYGIICLIQYILLLTIVTIGMIIPSLIATYKKPADALHHE